MEMEWQLPDNLLHYRRWNKCAAALASFSVLATVVTSSKSFLSCMARALHLLSLAALLMRGAYD